MKNYISYLFLTTLGLFLIACQNKADVVNQESGTPLKDSVPVILEEAVVEPSFNRTLSLQNITFEIKESGDQLTIQPSGYEIVNSLVSKDITGLSVVNTEIEDLNSDGFPEILIYLTSDGSGSYGTVLAFSSNQNKSMSEISFPSVADNPKANKGYMGHDEFTVVETTLTHRFPIYNDGDSNSKPSGKMRQIQYKLKDGEASRVFVIDKIIEF